VIFTITYPPLYVSTRAGLREFVQYNTITLTLYKTGSVITCYRAASSPPCTPSEHQHTPVYTQPLRSLANCDY